MYAPLSVSPSLVAGQCDKTFSYDAIISGGSGAYDVSWSFSPGPVLPSSTSSTLAGAITVVNAGIEYRGDITVTDQRTDVACNTTGFATVTPYGPLSVNLQPSAGNVACADAVDFIAHATGGTGSYTFTWSGWPCSGNVCTVDPSNDVFCVDIPIQVTLTDGLCPAAVSETETYANVTAVTATNN